MGDVTVAVCTFGGVEWVELAQRAILSANAQAPVMHRHAGTLADARNAALCDAETEWIVFLDADDELEPGYIDTLAAGQADVRAPAVRYITGGTAREPYVPRVPGHRHACEGDCLPSGNYIVIGALVRREALIDAGGFYEEPVYEDWSAWLRMWAAGASFESIPAAVYRAHVRQDSRNRAPSMEFKNEWHRRIAEYATARKAAA